MAATPVYEKDLTNSLCYVDAIQLTEFDNSINDINYIVSGITFIFTLSGFTSHFDISGHTYSNFILNNDIYTYTGLTGEIHYFEISDFYSGGTPTIDPLLNGLTEEEVIDGFSTSIISCTDKLDGLTGTCCPTQAVLSNLPWVVITNEGGGTDNCSNYIARRNEKGWMLDYVFNKNELTGWTDSVFFYTGVRDEYDPVNYGDNNLSFKFTKDGRIAWESYRYSGYCDTVSGYTPMYYISTGQTLPLCSGGTSDDFNITIVFERHNYYVDCELPNEGGWNDLIHTGYTSSTGSTIVTGETAEQLNVNWLNERNKRLGTLKIYHNRTLLQIDAPLSSIPNFRNLPVYEFKDWEEVILSDRGFQPFVHAVGGGVTGSGDLHNSVCCYAIKYAAYFEDIMNFPEILDRYTNYISPLFNIIECNEACIDEVIMVTPTPSATQISPSITPSYTPSYTPSITASQSLTPTVTPSISVSRTVTPSISLSRTPTPTKTISKTPSITPSVTLSATPSISLSITPTPTRSLTPSITQTIIPSITPTITKTPSTTPTITKTPTPTITPSITVSCARPGGLTEFNFLSLYDGPSVVLFSPTFNSACDAFTVLNVYPFYGRTGYTTNLSIGNPIYYPAGTDCRLIETGYYIVYSGGTPFIIYVFDGYINSYPSCPTPTPTPTLSLSSSLTPTASVTPTITPTSSG
jgi:hypothetical protein